MVKKLRTIKLRLTEKDFGLLKTRALVYANGDMTKWLTHAGINCPGKFLTDSELSKHIEKAVKEKARAKVTRA